MTEVESQSPDASATQIIVQDWIEKICVALENICSMMFSLAAQPSNEVTSSDIAKIEQIQQELRELMLGPFANRESDIWGGNGLLDRLPRSGIFQIGNTASFFIVEALLISSLLASLPVKRATEDADLWTRYNLLRLIRDHKLNMAEVVAELRQDVMFCLRRPDQNGSESEAKMEVPQ